MTKTISKSFGARSFAFVLLLALLGGCQSESQEDQPPTPDVSKIQVDARILRFDQDLFNADTVQFSASWQALLQKYPDFLPFFTSQVAQDRMLRQQTPEENLRGYVTAPQVRRLNDSCQAVFADLSPFQKELNQLFRFYKYYFPEKQVPLTVASVTEFVGDAYLINDTLMLLGLDLFLGADFSGYNPEIFPQYIRKDFSPDKMIVKYTFSLSNYLVPGPKEDRILDHMIRNGKALYVMDCLLPTVPDSVKMSYSTDQWLGSLANEQEVWSRLLAMKVLYEPLGPSNMKIVTLSPSSDNVFQEAPGQIGNFIGWQIVKAYMKKYPKTTLQELIQQMDAQQFLEKAKYKPRKTS
jgi:hypothetical protein